MSTPTLVAVPAPAPLTATHVAYATALQARAEAQAGKNAVARLPQQIKSSPRKVAEFFRLPQVMAWFQGAGGRISGWFGTAAAPAADFVSKVGVIPTSLLFATGDRGQATIRWVVRSAWGALSWGLGTVGKVLDGTLRIFGKPGNWLADKLMRGATKVMQWVAKPVGISYAVAAPLVSSKAGHVKAINRLARLLVVHRVVRMFVRNPLIAWPLELFIDLFVVGRAERALNASVGIAADLQQGWTDARTEAKARAEVDAHLVAEAARNAKVRLDTTVQAHRDTTIPQAMGKIGEVIEDVSRKADQVLNAQTPVATPSPAASSSGGDVRQEASESVDSNGAGHPESVEELAARLAAEGKIGLVTAHADTSREEQLAEAQRAADRLGEDVVAVTSEGAVVVEPTGSIVERVIEAEGPEMGGEAPVPNREERRALTQTGGGDQRKSPPQGKRRR